MATTRKIIIKEFSRQSTPELNTNISVKSGPNPSTHLFMFTRNINTCAIFYINFDIFVKIMYRLYAYLNFTLIIAETQ